MSTRISCSWCHTLNDNATRYWPWCTSCGHAADRPKSQCDCLSCKAGIKPLDAGTVDEMIELLARRNDPHRPAPADVPDPPRDAVERSANDRGITIRGRRFAAPVHSLTLFRDEAVLHVDDSSESERWMIVGIKREVLERWIKEMDRQ